jgi:tetratricopeptide (TPR) repeat protein
MDEDSILISLRRYHQLLSSGNQDSAAELARKIITQIKSKEDLELVIKNLGNTDSFVVSPATWFDLGNALYKSDQFDRAETCYVEALHLLGSSDEGLAAKLYHALGNTHFMVGDYESARQMYRESADRCDKLHLIAGTADNLTQLSDIARSLGDYEEAELLGRAASEINVRKGRIDSLARNIEGLCNLAAQLGATGSNIKAKSLLQYCLDCLQIVPHAGALETVKRTIEEV